MVGLTSVVRTYGQVNALRGVSLDLRAGVTVLLGRNGAGKSTLCRIIAGVEVADSGGLTRQGEVITERSALRAHHRDTGWLPQSLNVPATMTVKQYLGYAGWLKGLSRSEVGPAVDNALRCVGLQDMRVRLLRELSGGMLRRVGIAQAIVHDPVFLVLDEPSVGLDPEQRSQFHEIIRALSSDRVVLISTHLLEDVTALARRVAILDSGSILFDDSVDALVERGRAAGGRPSGEPLRDGFLSVVNGR